METRKYGSGALYAELQHVEGKLQGEQRYFYEDGTLKSLIPYRDDRLHGEVRLFHPDGILKRLISYEMGIRSGLEQLIDRNGTLLMEATFKAGELVDRSRRWYSSGQLAEEIHYKPDGIWQKQWDESGKLRVEVTPTAQRLFSE